jgi:hypothetical protein
MTICSRQLQFPVVTPLLSGHPTCRIAMRELSLTCNLNDFLNHYSLFFKHVIIESAIQKNKFERTKNFACCNELKWFHLLSIDVHFVAPRYFPFLVLQFCKVHNLCCSVLFSRETGKCVLFSLLPYKWQLILSYVSLRKQIQSQHCVKVNKE